MRTVLLCLGAAVLLAVGGFVEETFQVSKLRPEAVVVVSIDDMHRATWHVDNKAGGQGSAVRFASTKPLPQFLSAAHVFRPVEVGGKVVLTQYRRNHEGTVARYQIQARLLWKSTEWDLALLEGLTSEGVPPGALFGKAPKVGDKLRHVGNLLGTRIGVTYTEGVLAAVDSDIQLPGWPWKHTLGLTTALGLPGSSGGPIFDSAGRLVGILVGGPCEGLSVFVPVRDALPLLKTPPKAEPAEKEISLIDILLPN